jgi:hypothetical protein
MEAAAQALLAANGLGVLDVRLLSAFAALYTFPGLAMVVATSAARRRMTAPGDDASAVQVVRLTNRAIASTAMFILPALVVLRSLDVWSPWRGGLWCSPLDAAQRTLLHMQLMYYVMDTPYTLLKRDIEQCVHHAIGLGLALPTVQLGACGLPMCAIMFAEQARGRAMRRDVRRYGGRMPLRKRIFRRSVLRAAPPCRATRSRSACHVTGAACAGEQHLGAVHQAAALLPEAIQRAGARAGCAELLPELLPHGRLRQHAAAAARRARGARPCACAAVRGCAKTRACAH